MKNKFLGVVTFALLIAPLGGAVFLTATRAQNSGGSAKVLHGEGAFNDWANERPGNRYLIKASELPKPYATESSANQSEVVPRPADAWPQAPDGFKVDLLATGLDNPRA